MAQVWMRLEALAQQHGVMDQLQVFVAVRPRKPAHGLWLLWQRVRLMRHCGWCCSTNNFGGARLAGNEMCSVLTDFGQHLPQKKHCSCRSGREPCSHCQTRMRRAFNSLLEMERVLC